MDGEVAHELADELTADRKSKDGIARDLFPLIAKEQRKYDFRLQGEEDYRGTPCIELPLLQRRTKTMAVGRSSAD